MNVKTIIIVVGFIAWSALCSTWYIYALRQRVDAGHATATLQDSIATSTALIKADTLALKPKKDSTVYSLGNKTIVHLPKPVTFKDDTTIVSYLTQLASALQRSKDSIVTVVGHTDDVGQDDKNLALSYIRAREVMDYMVFKGAPLNKLRFIGKGEKEPLVADTTPEARNKNRRVEIWITK